MVTTLDLQRGEYMYVLRRADRQLVFRNFEQVFYSANIAPRHLM